MIQILESGQALYALAAVCILGLLTRLTARTLYRRLIRETDNMALTKNRYLREFKQKAENTYRLNQGITNTQAYLEKQINGYRFLGISLNGWSNLAGQMTLLCFLLGGAGSFLAYWYRCDTYYVVLYATIGILTGLLTMFLDIGVNLTEKHSQLLNVLQDYLENSLCLRLARETAAAADYAGGRDRLSGSAVQEPRAVSRDGVRTGSPSDRAAYDDGGTAGRDGVGREPSGSGNRAAIRSIARGPRSADTEGGRLGGPAADSERSGNAREPDFGDEARPLNRSMRRGERAGRKKTSPAAEEAPAADRGLSDRGSSERGLSDRGLPEGKELWRPDSDEVRRSLEQIAVSREKSRSDGEWLKELSPDELELVGEILKQYLE